MKTATLSKEEILELSLIELFIKLHMLVDKPNESNLLSRTKGVLRRIGMFLHCKDLLLLSPQKIRKEFCYYEKMTYKNDTFYSIEKII